MYLRVPRTMMTLLLLVALFVLPGWLMIVLMVAGILCIVRYYEGVLVACAYDVLYGTALPMLGGISGLVTVVAVGTFVLCEMVRPYLR